MALTFSNPTPGVGVIQVDGTDKLKFEQNGDLTIGGNLGFNGSLSATELLSGSIDGSGDLLFQRGNTERMRLTSDGKLGIGTTAPKGNLSVQVGSQNFYIDGLGQPNITINTIGGWRRGIIFKEDGSNNGASVLAEGTGTVGGTFLRFATDVDFNTDDGTGVSGEKMRLTSDGRLGIGTTAPISALTVTTDTNIDMDSNGTGQLSLGGSGYTAGFALNGQGLNIYHNSSFRSIIFGTNETERMRLTSDGKLGIGTTAPNAKLSVVGDISGNSVAVDEVNLDAGYGSQAPIFGVRAWGDISATGGLRAGGNISVTRRQTGLYDISFITTMPDTRYAVTVTLNKQADDETITVSSKSTGGFSVFCRDISTGNLEDNAFMFILVR